METGDIGGLSASLWLDVEDGILETGDWGEKEPSGTVAGQGRSMRDVLAFSSFACFSGQFIDGSRALRVKLQSDLPNCSFFPSSSDYMHIGRPLLFSGYFVHR
jgi:hypothetical protein